MKKWNVNRNDCGSVDHKYYANQEETERLLKLWDDANGSRAEWRENDRGMMKYDEDNMGCDTCRYYLVKGVCDPEKCRLSGGKYYANIEQTEALLKWHDYRFGKIGDISVDDSFKTIMTDLFSFLGYKKETDADDADFRIGDDVSFACTENGTLREIVENGEELRCEFQNANLYFRKDKNGYYRCGNHTLHHGNNLTVTVEKKKPKRMAECWVFVFLSDFKVPNVSNPYTSEEECLKTENDVIGVGGIILIPTQKVKIPK